MANPDEVEALWSGASSPAGGDGWVCEIPVPGGPDLGVLTRADRRKAARYRRTSQRWQFVATRALLRSALTQVIEWRVPPTAWRFGENDLGKPCVAADLPPIHFSVSHNEVASAVAVSNETPVGVDVERLDQPINDDLVCRFCSAREKSQLWCMNKEDRRRAFLRLWTLKEAYAKMTGVGSSTEFASFDFADEPPYLEDDPTTNFTSFSKAIGGKPCQISLAWLNPCGGTIPTRTANSCSHSPWGPSPSSIPTCRAEGMGKSSVRAGTKEKKAADCRSCTLDQAALDRAVHTSAPPASRACLHELFEAQADMRGSAVALVGGNLALTYAELNRAPTDLPIL